MNLLFDMNISNRIIRLIEPYFPASIHVRQLPVPLSKDIDIWNYAVAHQFTIVTFDEDFFAWQLLKNNPPRVVWLRCGNMSTRDLADKLIRCKDEINQFIEGGDEILLEIY
jgi:predicted nuclease of predicted toxin-antitoxin system